MGHSVQAFIASKHVVDRVQQRFGASRVIELSQSLYMLPMLPEIYDAMPGADTPSGEYPQFMFLSPKLVSLLTAESEGEAVAYFETDYFGGLGDQGAIVAKDGKIVFGPSSGSGAINSALILLGVKTGDDHDEFDAIGLGRFRSNEKWIEQSSCGRKPA